MVIAEVVEGPLVLLKIGGGQPVPHHHVGAPVQHPVHHLPGGGNGIGVVPVQHQITLGVDLPEHPADHVALPLLVLLPHHGAGRPGQVPGAVGGVVVVDVDRRLRQDGGDVPDHLGDGLALVIAWDQHGDGIHGASLLYTQIAVFSRAKTAENSSRLSYHRWDLKSIPPLCPGVRRGLSSPGSYDILEKPIKKEVLQIC